MKWPTRNSVSITELTSADGYSASFLIPSLARFVIGLNYPGLTQAELNDRALYVRFPFTVLPVFHNIIYHGTMTLDSIHASPRRCDADNNIIALARFDTALIRIRLPDPTIPALFHMDLRGESHRSAGRLSAFGLPDWIGHSTDTQVGQVHAIFSLPERAICLLFPDPVIAQQVPQHLVYIDWLSKFTTSPDEHFHMYTVRKLTGTAKLASVVPLTMVEHSIHLFPKWGGQAPVQWTSDSVLDDCMSFFVNQYKDPHSFYNMY